MVAPWVVPAAISAGGGLLNALFGGQEVQSIENMFTPLSEDILGILRKQIGGGEFGAGLGPLQRQAGTAAQQLVSSLQDPVNLQPLFQPFIESSRRETELGAANLRESFGIAGGRFGSPLAQGEATFRAEQRGGLEELLAGITMQQQEQLMQAITALQTMGQQNIAPFFQFAAAGMPQQMMGEGAVGRGTRFASELFKGLSSWPGFAEQPATA